MDWLKVFLGTFISNTNRVILKTALAAELQFSVTEDALTLYVRPADSSFAGFVEKNTMMDISEKTIHLGQLNLPRWDPTE